MMDPLSNKIRISDKYIAFSSRDIYGDLISVFQKAQEAYNFDAGALYLISENDPNQYELICSIGFSQSYCDQVHTIYYGYGFAGTAAALRSVRVSDDTSNDPRFIRKGLFGTDFKSLVSIPLVAGQSIMGLFNFALKSQIQISPKKRDALSLLGQALGIYVKDHLDISIVTQQEKVTRQLYYLGTEIFRINDLAKICNITLEESRALLNFSCAFIFLKPANSSFSNGFIEKNFVPEPALVDQISNNLKMGNYIIEKNSLAPSPLLDFFNKNDLEHLCLNNLGTGETPLGILAFGLGRNQYKTFDVLACNQIGLNLSVAINKHFYNANAREHAILKEHNHISRELHDSLAQQLSAISHKLEFIERQILGQQSVEQVLPELRHLRELIDLTNVDVRETITGLRLIKQEEDAPFSEIIKKYLLFFQKTCEDLEIEVDIEESLQNIPFKVQIQLFRIIQEIFANIRKHSRATKAKISIKLQDNKIIMKVNDNGVGFDTNKKSTGCGLGIILERAEEIGANLEISSVINKGTAITVVTDSHLFE